MNDHQRRTLIDIGSGPTIYSAICFRNVVQRVFLTDYLKKNLDIVQDWLDNRSSFQWNSVVDVVERYQILQLCYSSLIYTVFIFFTIIISLSPILRKQIRKREKKKDYHFYILIISTFFSIFFQ